jgi:hypothetical protein
LVSRRVQLVRISKRLFTEHVSRLLPRRAVEHHPFVHAPPRNAQSSILQRDEPRPRRLLGRRLALSSDRPMLEEAIRPETSVYPHGTAR